jgi:hypothetical protein
MNTEQKELEMKTYRKTAVAVGILYILATAMSLMDSVLTKGITGAAGHLEQLAGSGDQFIAGALLAVAAGLCVVVLAGLLFPLLRQRNEGAALAYFGVRILEAVTLVVTALSTLLLVTVGRESLTSGAAAASSLRATAAVIEGLHEWAFPLNPFVFGLGAVILYVLLYQTRLVPRWLSVWGLAAAGAVFAFSLLRFYGEGSLLLAVPIGVQEMVLAGWLIARGFDVSALAEGVASHAHAASARDLRETPAAPVIARPRTDP